MIKCRVLTHFYFKKCLDIKYNGYNILAVKNIHLGDKHNNVLHNGSFSNNILAELFREDETGYNPMGNLRDSRSVSLETTQSILIKFEIHIL